MNGQRQELLKAIQKACQYGPLHVQLHLQCEKPRISTVLKILAGFTHPQTCVGNEGAEMGVAGW
jgi:hypothetical protein